MDNITFDKNVQKESTTLIALDIIKQLFEENLISEKEYNSIVREYS